VTDETKDIGRRVKVAREALGLKQEELAHAVGFASRQILSDLERGVRDVKASEAARLARALRIDLASLLADAPARPLVLWRSQPCEGSEAIEAEFLQWRERQRRVLSLLDQRPLDQLPVYDLDLARMTYADADRLAGDVGQLLGLGVRPARGLGAALESRFDVTIWFLDTPGGCAACTRGGHGASILVPRSEAPWRRHFDIAHELFHLLTWSSASGSVPRWDETEDGRHAEQLANAFAASLLVPAGVVLRELDERSSERRVRLAELVAMARDFGVSLETLVWRLHNLGLWPEREVVRELLGDPRLRELDKASQAKDWQDPPSLPERFVQAAYAATLRGRLSRAQLATYLGCGLSELPSRLAEYGIDEDLAEMAARDLSVDRRSNDLDSLPMPSGQA
jgi:Zn-dependent peptidase ImmA (M78 family)/transcriptional regulator with XRE-family HTH domain